MPIYFKTKIQETSFDMTGENDDIILTMKAQLEGIASIPPSCQKWIFKGRILTDDMTLGEAGIEENNTVIVLKTTAASPPSPVPQPVDSSIASAPSYVNTRVFDEAMFILLQNSEDAVLAAVQLLNTISSNILKNPMDEKYRKLNRTKKAFSSKIGSVSGGDRVMVALGFQLVADDWILFPTAEAWENLLACQTKLDRFAVKLSIASSENSEITATAPKEEAALAQKDSSGSTLEENLNPMNIALVQQLLALAMQAKSTEESTSTHAETNSASSTHTEESTTSNAEDTNSASCVSDAETKHEK